MLIVDGSVYELLSTGFFQWNFRVFFYGSRDGVVLRDLSSIQQFDVRFSLHCCWIIAVELCYLTGLRQ